MSIVYTLGEIAECPDTPAEGSIQCRIRATPHYPQKKTFTDLKFTDSGAHA